MNIERAATQFSHFKPHLIRNSTKLGIKTSSRHVVWSRPDESPHTTTLWSAVKTKSDQISLWNHHWNIYVQVSIQVLSHEHNKRDKDQRPNLHFVWKNKPIIIPYLLHQIPEALHVACNLVRPVRLLHKPVTPRPRDWYSAFQFVRKIPTVPLTLSIFSWFTDTV